jgi:hypothetical protein
MPIMPHALHQSRGIETLANRLRELRVPLGDLPGCLRQAAWARGWDDVAIPDPNQPDAIRGHVVFARALSSGHALILVDDGRRAIGFCERISPPTVGAKVIVTPTHGTIGLQWSLTVIAELGCNLSVNFSDSAGSGHPQSDETWVEHLQYCLHVVRVEQWDRLREIDRERAELAFVSPVPSFAAECEREEQELRQQILATPYTEQERILIASIKRPDELTAFVAERNRELLERYAHELLIIHEHIEERAAAHASRATSYESFRARIDELNELDARARRIGERSLRASSHLEAIGHTTLDVRAGDLRPYMNQPLKYCEEIIATIELLFELLPQNIAQLAAEAY